VEVWYGVFINREGDDDMTITAKTMTDLLAKVYKANGWRRQAGESRTKRLVENYDVVIDYKNNLYCAAPKVSA